MFQALTRIGRRRALQGSAAALVVLGLLMWWLMPFGSSSPSGRLSFSTGVPTGVYQTYGTMLREALAQDLPNVKVSLQTSQGSQQNISRVAAGTADFAVATADAVDDYVRNGKPGADRLRGCARLYDDYIQLVVADSSKVRRTSELRKLRVAVGQDGSGVRLIAERMLRAAGVDPQKDITPVKAGIDTAPRLLEEGKIDAFFWSGGLPTNAVRLLTERFPVRLVPLDDLVAPLHRGGEPTRYYRSAVMPADAYPAARNQGSVPTLAVANILITADRTDVRLTEDFTRTVIRSRDTIGRQVHAAQLVDVRTAIYTDPLPLHEGARRYYRSVKP
ncbi:TAXI family TRAP transporter solute-binding subunit [Streptomyces beijiangensis]|uniref:TAXI family TRAP transporter solute-binding subunit n=1 Tax=Streptomyces beijiangensis TaxID=163361 RepID=A0A939F4N4_9ACTN|nr:TAXI family TRAP transporter solute-binding subunit [Streptomyces beijiangensis]MBO0511843.1 TAXI family TRAP transporter solute-binding subunit [Streptomyces beijiangensis]